MKFEITDFMGNKITLKPRLELYPVRDFMGKEMPGLAVALDDVSDGNEYGQYCMLTTSFDEFIGMKNCAYIDTNNCNFSDQLLEQGIAVNTGFTKHSGYCQYPLWAFDEEALKEMGAENYQKYNAAYEKYMAEFSHDDSEEGECDE